MNECHHNFENKVVIFPKYTLLGDNIVYCGAVRYLSIFYKVVYLVCHYKLEKHIKHLYEDKPSIKLICFHNNPFEINLEQYIKDGCEIRRCNYNMNNYSVETDRWPNIFYDELQVPRTARKTYFHIERTDMARTMYESIRHRPYIIVHEESGTSSLQIVKFLRLKGEARLIIDLNKNQVDLLGDPEGHAFANLIINNSITNYVYLLEGAEELHLIDSSMMCLAMHLDINRVKKRVCYSRTENIGNRYKIVDTFGLFEHVAI